MWRSKTGAYRVDKERLMARIRRCERLLNQAYRSLDGSGGLLSEVEQRLLRRGGGLQGWTCLRTRIAVRETGDARMPAGTGTFGAG
jgi:hypothetical protein